MYKQIYEFERDLSAGISAKNLIQGARERELPFRWHPLGFIVCTILIDGPFKARLHVWPVDTARSQGPSCQIHDHAFDLSSRVLHGCIENIEYVRDFVGITHARYEVEYRGDVSILERTGDTINLSVSQATLHEPGSLYGVAAGRLHQSRRAGLAPAVTAVVTRDASQNTPSVIGPLDGPVRYEYRRSILSNVELGEALKGIFEGETAST
jgi:hypothetical protein